MLKLFTVIYLNTRNTIRVCKMSATFWPAEWVKRLMFVILFPCPLSDQLSDSTCPPRNTCTGTYRGPGRNSTPQTTKCLVAELSKEDSHHHCETNLERKNAALLRTSSDSSCSHNKVFSWQVISYNRSFHPAHFASLNWHYSPGSFSRIKLAFHRQSRGSADQH